MIRGFARPGAGVGSRTARRWLVVPLVAVVVSATVVRLLGLDAWFPLVVVMTVYPYVVLLTLMVTVVALLLGLRAASVLAGATVLVGLALLVPRLLPVSGPAIEASGPQLDLAVLNLSQGGAGAAAIIDAVDAGSVDVLVALEVTEPSIDALEAAGIGRRLGHAELLPSRLTSGGGIWSRHPLTAREPSRLRGFGATPRATIDLPGHGPLDIDAVHPLPPITRAWTQSWRRVLRSLPPPSAGDSPRRLLAGDFNATLDHREMRGLLDQGWIDAAAARGAGLRWTFNGLATGEPVPPVTLDHVLVDPDVLIEDVTIRSIPGTDHRMLLVRLRLPPG